VLDKVAKVLVFSAILYFMKLVVPSSDYKESFIQAARECQNEIEEKATVNSYLYTLPVDTLQNDFKSYLKKIEGESFGKGLPEGFVPQTTYWLVDHGEFIGRVSIRHILTEHLLKEGGHLGYDIRPSKRKLGYGKRILTLALPKAKALGITKVLVTCDETNLASKRIIEFNGGAFENSISLDEGKPKKLRYWFDLS
jgi:predicted acetyltransferase